MEISRALIFALASLGTNGASGFHSALDPLNNVSLDAEGVALMPRVR